MVSVLTLAAGGGAPGGGHSGQMASLSLTRVSLGMSPYAAWTADRIGSGRQGWTPSGIIGWRAYDLSPPVLVHRQLTFDEARAFNALVPVSNTPIQPMKAFILKAGNDDYNRALDCLSQAIYYEAGFEPGEGQAAVAQVVLNRLQHPAYPKTVCGVVYQGSQLVTGCQFSFTCDGSLTRQPAEGAWKNSRDTAMRALAGYVYAPVGTATHYHADYVVPYWAPTLVKLRQIGAHIFYRMTGPMGAPAQFDGKYAGGEAILTSAILTGGDTRTPDAPSAPIALPTDQRPIVEPRLVTLTIGGETKTYAVAAANAPPAVPESVGVDIGDHSRPPAPVGPISSGTIVTTRRMPTPDEIRDINEKIRQRQMQSLNQNPTTSQPGF